MGVGGVPPPAGGGRWGFPQENFYSKDAMRASYYLFYLQIWVHYMKLVLLAVWRGSFWQEGIACVICWIIQVSVYFCSFPKDGQSIIRSHFKFHVIFNRFCTLVATWGLREKQNILLEYLNNWPFLFYRRNQTMLLPFTFTYIYTNAPTE